MADADGLVESLPTHALDAGTTLDLAPCHTITLLHRLTTGGWLTRIKKGLYVLNDRVNNLPKAHPFAIGTDPILARERRLAARPPLARPWPP